MGKIVPLVVYLDGERKIIGDADVLEDGTASFIVRDADIVEKLHNIEHNAFSIVSFGDMEEADRCARAYGYEIGKGRSLAEHLVEVSDDNPFMYRDWKDAFKNKEKQ